MVMPAMKTRRKGKAAGTESTDAADTSITDDAVLELELPEDLDVATLATLIPNVSFNAPSAQTVLALYHLVLAQVAEIDATQRELDETRAELDKKEVELDQVHQDHETTVKELEAAAEAALADAKLAKAERDQFAASSSALQAQISTLGATHSASSTEVGALKRQIADIEREKRDLMGVVSRLQQDSTARNDEVHTLRTNLKQARQEHQELESQVRELRSSETSNKFKLDTLEQQLNLAKEENERMHVELATNIDEHTKYRKDKHAELVKLQIAHDTLAQSHSSSQNSLQFLQKSHSSQSHQLTQALQRVQDLTGQLADQEARFSSEMTSMRRLVQMLEEKDAKAKEIVESIERDWAGVGAKADGREQQLLDQIERERRRSEALENQVEEFRGVLDRIDSGELPVPGRPAGSPAMEPDPIIQGMVGLSPTVAMASRMQKSGKTFTEVYADYIKLQELYAKKSTEYDHMERTLSSVLAQIEERAPILAQQRVEYERLQAESTQLASQLSQAIHDREVVDRANKDVAQRLVQTNNENKLVHKQLADLGRQVQMLTREIARRDDPTIPTDSELEAVAPAENIEAVITNNLVLFRSIPELQEQNQKLLKIVRDLGAKMEAEEKEYKTALENEQAEAVVEAHAALVQLQEDLAEQKRSSDVTIKAYVNERDALKSMLARMQKGGVGVAPSSGHVNGHDDGDALDNELQKEFADMQESFESYRNEIGADSQRLRDDLTAAHREAGQLGATLAKANARIEFLNDRNRMAQEELSAQSREIDSLMDRNQQLYDKYTRVDIECNRAVEELTVSHSQLEKLRNEAANLRAEKRIWEAVQTRLADENKTLTTERSHMSDLLANVQKMHNDLERSNENDRRRLETQISTYEVQIQDIRTQLNQEREATRQLTLQKDVEIKELSIKSERVAQEHARDRESLAAAQTSNRHLEERVTDLVRLVKGSEEKLSVYERRPMVTSDATVENAGLSTEQELEAELAELRAELKVAQMDLEAARTHVTQFQEISKANEAALASLSNTYDEYKTLTESQLVARESDYKALEGKYEAVKKELSEATEKYTTLQAAVEKERSTFSEEKRELEGAIADVSSAQRNWDTDRVSRESQLQLQEQRAKAAEDRYERELISHAEAVKHVEQLKQQLIAVQTSVREARIAAETSQSNLSTSEASWKVQKEALEKELADVNNRCKDLSQQNQILHEHLQTAHSQAELIRKAADATGVGETAGETSSESDVKLSELRSVISFLRREKEIGDLQLELGKQESARLKVQIETLSHSLDETRRTLSEERESASEVMKSTAQHSELMEKINQVAILRESNATIRAECESHQKRARELENKLRDLSQELGPAKEQARMARAELDARDAQLKKAEEEAAQWQTRNQQLLTKYDRTDPAELQSLKDQVETLQAELVKKSELNRRLGENVKHLRDIRQKDGEIVRNNKAALVEAQAALQTTTTARDELQARLDNSAASSNESLQTELDTLKKQATVLKKQIETLSRDKAALIKEAAESKAQNQTKPSDEQEALIATLQQERDKLLAESKVLSGDSSLEDARKTWEAEKDTMNKQKKQLITLSTNKQTALQTKIATLTQQLEEANKQRTAETERLASEKDAALEKLRGELSAATAAVSTQPAEHYAQELRDLEARLKAQHQAELKAAVDAAVASAAKDMPVTAVTSNGDQSAAIAAAIAAHDKEIETKHAEEIAAAVERGRQEQAKRSQLKDAQLVKARDKVKELEAQILEWRKGGLLPENGVPTTTAQKQPAGALTTATAPIAAVLPRKPSLAPSTSSVTVNTADAGNPTGRGRGSARGVRGAGRAAGSTRGGAPGRGGAPQAAAAAAAASVAAPAGTGGMSIMGAASKRAREEGDTTPEDSLAKRIKGPEGSKPVVLRRPPPSS